MALSYSNKHAGIPKPSNTVFIVALLALAAFLFIGGVPLVHVSASGCPSYLVTEGSTNYLITVTAYDGSCPTTYSNSPLQHLLLLTGDGSNPYTVTVACQVSGCTTPNNIVILGWGNVAICGSSQSLSGPACTTGGPWSGHLDATVQATQACNTAPLKIDGNGGQPELILEAGVGGDCATTNTSVPQFPGFGLLAVLGMAIPMMLLLRRGLPTLKI